MIISFILCLIEAIKNPLLIEKIRLAYLQLTGLCQTLQEICFIVFSM